MRLLLGLLLSISLWAYEDFVQQAYYDSYAYEKTQSYAEAIRSMRVVYERYPKAYTPNLRLGWLFYLNKNYVNALSHYKNAVDIVPSSVEAKLGWILVLKAQEKYADAKRLIYDVLKSDPYNYYSNMYLVDVLNANKEYEQSLKVISKMLQYYPTDVYFLSRLAYIYTQEGKHDLATGVYLDILILDPSNPDAISYLNRK